MVDYIETDDGVMDDYELAAIASLIPCVQYAENSKKIISNTSDELQDEYKEKGFKTGRIKSTTIILDDRNMPIEVQKTRIEEAPRVLTGGRAASLEPNYGDIARKPVSATVLPKVKSKYRRNLGF